jgi:hypothetical protein
MDSQGLFTRWRDVSIDFEGVEVEMRLRAPLSQDGRALQRKVRAWNRGVLKTIDETAAYIKSESEAEPDDSYGLFDQVFGEEWARGCFARNVKLKTPALDDEGKGIEGGAALFDAMGVGERVTVLRKLENLAHLRGTEGKASSSRSTSSAETAASDSNSTATPTVPGDGPAR